MRTCPQCGAGLRERRDVCPSCGARVNDFHSRSTERPPHATKRGRAEPSALDQSRVDPPKPPKRRLSRLLPMIIAVPLVIGLLTVGIWTFVAWVTLEENEVMPVTVGDTTQGVIGPETPLGMANKPFVDHDLAIRQTGLYEISLRTENSETFDPYLSLLREGHIVTNDDNSGEGTNAVIRQRLTPGNYTVRVTRYQVGALQAQARYSISVNSLDQYASSARSQ